MQNNQGFQQEITLEKILLGTGWALITSMACYLSFVTLIYFSFRSDIYFLLAKQGVVHNIYWRTAFYLHITGGLLSLGIGPFQFLKKFRQKHISFHRTLGKIYIGAILFLGGPAGFYMSLFANGGFWAKISFSLLSFLWTISTWIALRTIRKKNIKKHEQWMIRSYAITFSAVMLRLWVPILSLGFHARPDQVLFLSPWLAWMPNLLIAEIIIYLKKQKLVSKDMSDYNLKHQ